MHSPNSTANALALLAEHGAALTPIAGGTDLLVSWHHRPHAASAYLDLSRLGAELRQLRWSADALEIGALSTYWNVIVNERCNAELPLLVQAARQVGAIQIQTRGTWAGNIGNGSPAADGVPVLMAYDAMVVLASVRGRREVPLAEYYTGYRKTVRAADELIESVRVPLRQRDIQWFHKVGARAAQAITKVGVAVVHDGTAVEGGPWRVVANSVAPTVCRCRTLEAALAGGTRFATPDEIADVLRRDIAPIDDIRSTAEYRMTALSRLLHQFLKETCGW